MLHRQRGRRLARDRAWSLGFRTGVFHAKRARRDFRRAYFRNRASNTAGVAPVLLTSQIDVNAIFEQQRRTRVNALQLVDALPRGGHQASMRFYWTGLRQSFGCGKGVRGNWAGARLGESAGNQGENREA